MDIQDISKVYYDTYKRNYDEYMKNVNENDRNPLESPYSTEFKTKFKSDFDENLNGLYSALTRKYPGKDNTIRKIYNQVLVDLAKGPEDPVNQGNVDFRNGKISIKRAPLVKKAIEEMRVEIINSQKNEKTIQKESTEKSLKADKIVDFSNPEEKKKFWKDFYGSLKNCKNLNEKVNHLKKYGLDISDMSVKEQSKLVSDLELKHKYDEIKDKYVEKIENDEKRKNLSDEEKDKLASKNAKKHLMKKYDITLNEFNSSIEKGQEIQKYMEAVIQENDIEKIQEIKKRFEEFKKENYSLEEREYIDKEVNKKLKKVKEKKSTEMPDYLGNISNEVENSDVFGALFDTALKEDLDKKNQVKDNNKTIDDNDDEVTMPGIESEEKTNNEENKIIDSIEDESLDMKEYNKIPDEPIIEDKENDLTNILDPDKVEEQNDVISKENNDNNELKQSDYTMEINENKGLWNKIKNVFKKIKNKVASRFETNKNKSLKGQELLEEGNIDEKAETNKGEIFSNSLKVSEKELEENKEKYEQKQEKNKKGKTSEIQVEETLVGK